MKILFYAAVLVLFINGKPANKTEFTPEALNQQITTVDGDTIAFKEVIAKHKGKTIVLDFWASWCSDCIKALPAVKKFEGEHSNEIVFVTLSMDRKQEAWVAAIDKLGVPGNEHYFVPGGFKSAIGLSAELSWIPRYLVLDKEGNIQIFNTIKVNKLEEALFTI
ncbi:MAG: alkyl hydroperoxide reductase [Flavobacteriaceae bacterium]|nr:MAG: alkyl hydroperoxide reductase [Flavobacteriaceae bacterium]